VKVGAKGVIHLPTPELLYELFFGFSSGSECYEYSASFAVAFTASCAQKK
jgi:hypothetical protein